MDLKRWGDKGRDSDRTITRARDRYRNRARARYRDR